MGRDVLTDNDGKLIPIQWTGYVDGVKRYQGKVLNKTGLYDAFIKKIESCNANPNLINNTDWKEMQLLLQTIFKAFA